MGGASACPKRAKPFWGRRLAVCCAHNLFAESEQIPHLQTEKCFLRRTRRRKKRIAFDLPPAGGKICEAFLTVSTLPEGEPSRGRRPRRSDSIGPVGRAEPTSLQALSVTFGDSSPRGRAKSTGPAALSGPGQALQPARAPSPWYNRRRKPSWVPSGASSCSSTY